MDTRCGGQLKFEEGFDVSVNLEKYLCGEILYCGGQRVWLAMDY